MEGIILWVHLQHNFFNMVAGNIKDRVCEGKYRTAANSNYKSFMKNLRVCNIQLDNAALYIAALNFKKNAFGY
jgi:hypothetical protein